jgi:cyclic pyranopterin phosphate synthase
MPREGVAQIGHDDILRYEEISRIVRMTARLGVSKIRITGGEPLVRRDVASFIRSLTHVRGIEDLSMTTNGILLAPHAAALKEAGLKRVNVSMDSLDPTKYSQITRGGSLEEVWNGIREAERVTFSPIKINVVVVKDFNDDEILQFASLSLHNPFEIRFIEFMPVGPVSAWHYDQCVSSEAIRSRIEEAFSLEPCPYRQGNGPARLFRIAGARGTIGFISSVSSHFCATCNRLRLTADGKLRSCLFSDEEVDLKGPLRAGCVDSELEDLILQAARRKPKQHYLQEPALKKCARTMSAIGG